MNQPNPAMLDRLLAISSPILEILARPDESATAAAWREMRERLQVFATADGWRGPKEWLLTVGRRGQETD